MIISNCFTGNSISVNSNSFQNFSAFKNYVIEKFELYDNSNSNGNDIIILSDSGIKVKESNFRNFEVSYVFNKDLLNVDNETNNSNYTSIDDEEENNNSLIKPVESPLSIIDSIDRYSNRQLISFLTTNLSWSDALLNDSKIIESLISINVREIYNKVESINIVCKYLKKCLAGLNKKFTISKKVLISLNEDETKENTEEINYHKLERIALLDNPENDDKKLSNLIDYHQIFEKIKYSKQLKSQLNSENLKVENQLKRLQDLLSDFDFDFESFKTDSDIIIFTSNDKNESKPLIMNIERIFQIFQSDTKKFINKIPSNYYNDLNLRLSDEENNLLEITLMNFKENLIPEFEAYFKKLYNLQKVSKKSLSRINRFLNDNSTGTRAFLSKTNCFLNDLHDLKNDLKLSFFQKINDLQMIKSQISIIFDLPFLYGIYLIEALRRSNLNKKTQEINSNQLAFKRDWYANYGHILSILDITEHLFINSDIVSITSPSNNVILKISTQVIEEYITSLENNGIPKDYITALTSELKNIGNNDEQFAAMYATSQYDEIIRGYQSRIKRLESMLHEQKYNNSWQNNGNGNNSSNNSNLNHSFYNTQLKPPIALNFAKANSTTTSINNIVALTKSKSSSSFVNNPKDEKAFGFSWIKKKDPKKELLNKLNQDKNIELVNSIILPRSYECFEKNDGTDKLEKGIIRKYNDDSKSTHKESVIDQDYIKVSNSEWNKLKNQNNQLVVKINEIRDSQDLENKKYRKKIEELTDLMNLQQTKNQNLKEENTKLKTEVSNLKDGIITMNNNFKNFAQDQKILEDNNLKYLKEIEDLNNFKNNIMANLQGKENEFKVERKLNSDKISKLNVRIENLETTEDELITINKELNIKILLLFKKFNNLLKNIGQNNLKFSEIFKIVNGNYHMFFNILKSIGLLIINNDENFNGVVGSFFSNEAVKILRVKGLKNTKVESNLLNDFEKKYNDLFGHISGLNIDLIDDEYSNCMTNNDDTVKPRSEDSAYTKHTTTASENEFVYGVDDSQLNTLEIQINNYYSRSSDYNLELTDFIKFVNSIDSEDLIFNAIIKRFKDIESLAKKLQKNQVSSSSKITIKNFKVNDLVLFLPTTDEEIEDKDKDINSKPWVAFNIGSPHYFLNKVYKNEKDYLIAKVIKIQQFKVTEENVDDPEKNKYNLSVGLTWFLVDVEECNEDEFK